MKKILFNLISTIILLFSIGGTANATIWSETKDLDVWLGGVNTYSWTHSTPADFSIPPDTLNSATLTVEAYYVDGNNDRIYVEGLYEGALQNAQWVWTGFLQGHYEGTTYDLANLFGSWSAGDTLNVSLNYIESGWLNALYLDTSTLRLDYNQAAPVPEPMTLVLLGSGLLGLAGLRNKNKK